MTVPAVTRPFVLGPEALPAGVADAVLNGAAAGEPPVAILDVTGPGAVSCLQGLLTSDIAKPGEGSYLYGALLTAKGMILTDLWIARLGGRVRLHVPPAGLAPLLDVFRRSLPPRLARVTDQSGDRTVLRVAGPRASDLVAAMGMAVPTEGRAAGGTVGEATVTVARVAGAGPFAVEIGCARADVAVLRQALARPGIVETSAAALDLARILAGWPALGAEIDDRTLPQEVRLDEIGGVSFTKGCFVGQETVARLHFRGHANRLLRGLMWESPPDPDRPAVTQDDKDRGRVTSMVWLPAVERWIGLGVLRREVDLERPVTAGGAPATATALPFPAA
jgi:folate-binding protein YgfZ